MPASTGWEKLIDPAVMQKAIDVDPAVDKAALELAEAVAAEWRRNSPEDTGEYKDHIEVVSVPGITAKRVTNDYYTAAWIEDGTGEPGPTREYAPMHKTAHKFKGTPDLEIVDGGAR